MKSCMMITTDDTIENDGIDSGPCLIKHSFSSAPCINIHQVAAGLGGVAFGCREGFSFGVQIGSSMIKVTMWPNPTAGLQSFDRSI